MCGIVAYSGSGKTSQYILDGLRRLEYRGYDSSGMALMADKTMLFKAAGHLENLEKMHFPEASQGIGHTRWATHGPATEKNAHPHQSGAISIVHNGIIENYKELKANLQEKGYEFTSDTDSETFAHLVQEERKLGRNLREAVAISFRKLKGSSAFVVMDEAYPGLLVAVRRGSPLLVARNASGLFIASDAPALGGIAEKVSYLEEEVLAEVSSMSFLAFDLEGNPRAVNWSVPNLRSEAVHRDGHAHFMAKEIHEQPAALERTISPWISSQSLCPPIKFPEELRNTFYEADMIHFVACGTAGHAALYGQYLFEAAGFRARFELASEFRYRRPVLRSRDVGFLVTQSGETADTIAAAQAMRNAGMKIVALCNVPESTLARLADTVLFTEAGTEIGVASTKAFTTQLAVLAMAAAWLKREKNEWLQSLKLLPSLMKEVLSLEPALLALAEESLEENAYLFLGRGLHYPIALEGALKLKEIAYVSAEGYAAGELKHGPIARIEENSLTLVLLPKEGELLEKTLSNAEEVLARKGKVRTIGPTAPLGIPSQVPEELLPILSVLPLQLFSYHVARLLGHEVDKPRNLAKSVTVE